MGTRGQVPKRSDALRRRNKTDEQGNPLMPVEKVVVDPAVLADTSLVPAPDPDPNWHPLALSAYENAKRSAMRDFYEPTDWATLLILCEQLSRWMSPVEEIIQMGPRAGEVIEVEKPMPGATLTAILKGFSSLLFTEADRRRLRMEVERVPGSATGDGIAAPSGDNVINIRRDRFGA